MYIIKNGDMIGGEPRTSRKIKKVSNFLIFYGSNFVTDFFFLNVTFLQERYI